MVTQIVPRKGLGDLTQNNLGQVKKIFETLFKEKEISEHDLKEAIASGELSKLGYLNDVACGFVISKKNRVDKETRVSILYLCVLPSYKNLGIESLMVKHIVEQAKKMKTSIISCESESIQDAQDAFEEHGFVETQDGQMSLKDATMRRTKIVATLGPASIPRIKDMILAGVNVFRVNFSHVKDPETQTPIIEDIRASARELDIPVAILGDLGGPKIRCNEFVEGEILLTEGEFIHLKHSTGPGNKHCITTSVNGILEDLSPGNRILLDDGYLILTVHDRVSPLEVNCKIVSGGILKARKGINLPDVKIPIPALTEKDKVDAKYMWKMRLDYVALSFVQKAQDVQDLLNFFQKCNSEFHLNDDERNHFEEGWRPHIISKIEKPAAILDINEILKVTDGIMVARGDLGVEASLDKVPVIQKMLIHKANEMDKPVITATQMLESMIEAQNPTRAEVSDVANAVFDGTDAVMLSAEAAVGKYPIEAVKMMSQICITAEAGDFYMQAVLPMQQPGFSASHGFGHAIADAAVAAANHSDAKALIVFTTSAEMAIIVSKKRPKCLILAVTPTESIYRRLFLLQGIYPILSTAMKIKTKKGISKLKDSFPEHPISPSTPTTPKDAISPNGSTAPVHRNTDYILARGERDILQFLKQSPLVKKNQFLAEGDTVVYCAGFHGPFPGLSNTIRLAKFGEAIHGINARQLWGEAMQLVKDR